ncbi:MAG: TolC family protein [Spirochaetaceae bacterium]|jgi:outer membrane protein TolC|nr:TolC family protein [Spirochaetaceae bacterium]
MKKWTILFLILESAAAFAQDAPVVLTVDGAVDYALKHSFQLKSAAIDLEIQKRAKDNAWNSFLPGVNVSGTLSRSNEDTSGAMMESIAAMMNPLYGAVKGFHGTYLPPEFPASITIPEAEEKDLWRMVGTLSFSWSFNAAMIQNMRAVHADYEAGLISWEQTQKQVELNVRKLFYGLLMMQESLKIQQASLESARGRAEQAEVNYRNGRIPQIQMLQAQVAYENQRPGILKAEQAIDQQIATFAFLLGFPSGTRIALDGSIDEEFLAASGDAQVNVDTENLGSRTDLRFLSQNIAALRLRLSALNLSAYTPSLALSYNLQPVAAFSSLDNADLAWKDKWTDNGALSITLAWNLTNLLPFSSTQQQAKDLKANISKLLLQSDMLIEQAKNKITSLMDSLELSRSQIEANQRNVTLAQTAYTMTETSWRNGTTELLDLRDAESSLNQAKLGVLNEKFNYLSALLDLEYELNTKLIPGD